MATSILYPFTYILSFQVENSIFFVSDSPFPSSVLFISSFPFPLSPLFHFVVLLEKNEN